MAYLISIEGYFSSSPCLLATKAIYHSTKGVKRIPTNYFFTPRRPIISQSPFASGTNCRNLLRPLSHGHQLFPSHQVTLAVDFFSVFLPLFLRPSFIGCPLFSGYRPCKLSPHLLRFAAQQMTACSIGGRPSYSGYRPRLRPPVR